MRCVCCSAAPVITYSCVYRLSIVLRLLLFMACVLTFLSLNLNSITCAAKWKIAAQFFRNNDADVVFLQEVSCVHPPVSLPYNVYTNVGATQRGTAILTRPGLELTNVECHPDGRIITGRLRDLLLVNVYAPSGTQNRVRRNEFYRDTIMYYLRDGHDNILFGGDHNCLLNSGQSSGNPNICWPLHKLVTGLHLEDVVDVLNITRTHYTCVGPVSSSRIDRFYISASARQCVRSYDTIPVSFSNHHAVLLRLTGLPRAQVFGRSYWKLNCTHLYNADVYNTFCNSWNSWKTRISKYCSISEWWSLFAKPSIQRFFRQVSFNVTRERRSTLEFYYRVLRDLQRQNDAGQNVAADFTPVRRKLLHLQEQNLCTKVRASNDKFFFPGERHSLYHLMQGRQRETIFHRLLHRHSQHEVLHMMTTHFTTFYSATAFDAPATQALLEQCTRSLSSDSQRLLTRPVLPDELDEIINTLPSGKSPGEDGIPYEFYKHFWKVISPEMGKLVSERLSAGNIYPTREHGIIVLIPKSRSPSTPADYRPITLLCADAKIIARVLARRLKAVVSDIIGEEQHCGVPGGSIIHCLSQLRDAILLNHSYPNLQLGILNIDLQNAFDRVNHDYLRAVLHHMGFPALTIRQLLPLNQHLTSRIQLQGHLSPSINILRSVRQGCPLSMLLFVLSLEPVLRTLAANIVGNHVGGRRIALAAYADDITVFVKNIHDITSVSRVFDTFQVASGALINAQKTKLLWLGDNPPPDQSHRYVSCTEMKVLGMICKRTIVESLHANWTQLVNKIRAVFLHLEPKSLNLLQRVHIVNVFALSKLWYIAQVIPIPRVHCAQLLKYVGWFLWKGHIFKCSRSQLTLPRLRGGLGLVCIETKIQSLLFKNMMHAITQDSAFQVHFTAAWGLHPIGSASPRPLPRMFSTTVQKFSELIEQLPIGFGVSTRTLYAFIYARSSIQPPVELKRPGFTWPNIWRNLSDRHIPGYLRAIGFFFVNDLFPTNVRRHNIHLAADAQCTICGHADTAVHRLLTCTAVLPLCSWLKLRASRLLGTNPFDVDLPRLLHLDFKLFPEAKRRTLVWAVCLYIDFIISCPDTPTLQGLQTQLCESRRALVRNRHLYIWYGYYIHTL